VKNIKYEITKNFIGWSKTEAFVQKLILKNNLKSILEIGAGANPTIHPEFISKHNLKYTICDIDDDELKKADGIYSKLVIDLSLPDSTYSEKFDLVFSRMVGEHISDAKTFHQNVFNILNKDGISFHCFSTLYALPFTANRYLPESMSDLLLHKIAPRDEHQHGKFKAYYDWSRGPSKKMIKRFENIGYEIIEYVGYFGHNYYSKIALLNKIEEIKSKLLIKFPIPFLTSYAHLILRKP
jgi:2-polyprenyl-3-methyl-5-hydroxy-6-metoxy-1,4-benzoquinol methylase